ncbi:MAG: RHS repeat protein [Acidobacteria bacterium]|nr:RHS repeat protein [Acidobacteriota bacterium]MBI3472375.1 RHS repeat protein [Candidatus Solibacter usitatus]
MTLHSVPRVFALAAAFALAGTVNYTYDDAGRLTKVDYGDGKTITYTYDAAGNLLKREVTTGAAAAPAKKAEPAKSKPAVKPKDRAAR